MKLNLNKTHTTSIGSSIIIEVPDQEKDEGNYEEDKKGLKIKSTSQKRLSHSALEAREAALNT